MDSEAHTSLLGQGDGYSKILEIPGSLLMPMSSCWGCYGQFLVAPSDEVADKSGSVSGWQLRDCSAQARSTRRALEDWVLFASLVVGDVVQVSGR